MPSLRFVTTGKKCPFYKRNMCYGTLLRNTPLGIPYRVT
jgi:hypothetical protein